MGIGKAGAMEGQEGKGFEGHVMNSNWANLIYKWIKWNEVFLQTYVSYGTVTENNVLFKRSWKF